MRATRHHIGGCGSRPSRARALPWDSRRGGVGSGESCAGKQAITTCIPPLQRGLNCPHPNCISPSVAATVQVFPKAPFYPGVPSRPSSVVERRLTWSGRAASDNGRRPQNTTSMEMSGPSALDLMPPTVVSGHRVRFASRTAVIEFRYLLSRAIRDRDATAAWDDDYLACSV
ncbi:hypothetical protein EJ04DRAFT_81250 [Polyplosphaeria fusca]|uniref:Uncharacterized protein n=1 Tax=Polyplosphaeria fusca TaxID=682080 RepID=A0A9P4QKN1_9PLEO|nr:hypothetical protein EJ04DRAFT_81250 [Polyplosphaeria fusca]